MKFRMLFSAVECSINWVDFLVKLEVAVRKKPPARPDGSSILLTLKEKASKDGLTDEQITRLVQISTSKKYSTYI